MLTRVSGAITGGIAFAAGAYMLFRQFTDPTAVQGFAVGMGIALLIGGVAAVMVSRPRR